jgi:hypothetical protein
MKAEDVPTCVQIVAADPSVAPRYGSAIADLGPALVGALRCDAMRAIVFEELRTGSPARLWGFGVTVFVSDEFLRELKTPPLVWIGPELARRMRAGRSPVLSDKQFRDANSRDGLNLVVWEVGFRPEDLYAETYNKMMNTFVQEHRGYLLNEVIVHQPASREALQSIIKTGAMLLDPVTNLYREFISEDSSVFQQPHILGLQRKLELNRPAPGPARYLSTGYPKSALAAASSACSQRLSLAVRIGISRRIWKSPSQQ